MSDNDSAGGTVGTLVGSAGTGFVVIAFVVPVLAAIVAVGWGDISFLNLVHVVSGAVWAGATVFVAGVFGPTLVGLEPQVRGQVNTPLIPKAVFLFSGVTIATLLTGPVLAVRMGIWNLANPFLLAALIIAIGLLLGAAYLIWLQINVFTAATGEGPPDAERLARLGGRIGMVSPAMLVLQVAILVDMTLLATV